MRRQKQQPRGVVLLPTAAEPFPVPAGAPRGIVDAAIGLRKKDGMGRESGSSMKCIVSITSSLFWSNGCCAPICGPRREP
jgi:hypothetical protein